MRYMFYRQCSSIVKFKYSPLTSISKDMIIIEGVRFTLLSVRRYVNSDVQLWTLGGFMGRIHGWGLVGKIYVLHSLGRVIMIDIYYF